MRASMKVESFDGWRHTHTHTYMNRWKFIRLNIWCRKSWANLLNQVWLLWIAGKSITSIIINIISLNMISWSKWFRSPAVFDSFSCIAQFQRVENMWKFKSPYGIRIAKNCRIFILDGLCLHDIWNKVVSTLRLKYIRYVYLFVCVCVCVKTHKIQFNLSWNHIFNFHKLSCVYLNTLLSLSFVSCDAYIIVWILSSLCAQKHVIPWPKSILT